MISSQNPNIPNPLQAVEIDAVVFDLQLKLDTNLSWLTHNYARAYRNFQYENGSLAYYPEVYAGTVKGTPTYFQPRPDNDKKGTCYFVVGKERQSDFNHYRFNYLNHDLSIVFWVNLNLINKLSLDTELITQQLIFDVRSVLTRKLIGSFYQLKIVEVVREFSEVFREYTLKEKENYLKAPYQAFRFNCTVEFQENCITLPIDKCQILNQNISAAETLCLLPKLDFSDDVVFNTLTDEQKAVLTIKLT